MRIKDFQEMIFDIYYDRDSKRGVDKTMLWLIEEVGELAEAVRKGESIGEEVADVIAWTFSIANLYDVNIEEEITKKYPGNCMKCGKKPCRCEE